MGLREEVASAQIDLAGELQQEKAKQLAEEQFVKSVLEHKAKLVYDEIKAGIVNSVRERIINIKSSVEVALGCFTNAKYYGRTAHLDTDGWKNCAIDVDINDDLQDAVNEFIGMCGDKTNGVNIFYSNSKPNFVRVGNLIDMSATILLLNFSYEAKEMYISYLLNVLQRLAESDEVNISFKLKVHINYTYLWDLIEYDRWKTMSFNKKKIFLGHNGNWNNNLSLLIDYSYKVKPLAEPDDKKRLDE